MIFLDKQIKEFLEKLFEPETRPVQNLLFWGEEFTGKKTIALAFAQSLLCLKDKKKWSGCRNCQSCLRLKKGYHPDLMVLSSEDDTLKMNNAIKAIEFLSYKPQFSKFRILIIDNAEQLTEEAQNAFLKTLEEPAENCLVILISSMPDKLLETVRSRLLPLRFKKLSTQKITNFLIKNFSIEPEKAKKISELSEGKICLALKFKEGNFLEKVEKIEKDLENILKADFNEQSRYCEQLTKDKKDKSEIFESLKIWLRFLKREIKNEIKGEKTSLKLSLKQRAKLAKEILTAYNLINDSNINTRLLLENIFLNYVQLQSS